MAAGDVYVGNYGYVPLWRVLADGSGQTAHGAYSAGVNGAGVGSNIIARSDRLLLSGYAPVGSPPAGTGPWFLTERDPSTLDWIEYLASTLKTTLNASLDGDPVDFSNGAWQLPDGRVVMWTRWFEDTAATGSGAFITLSSDLSAVEQVLAPVALYADPDAPSFEGQENRPAIGAAGPDGVYLIAESSDTGGRGLWRYNPDDNSLTLLTEDYSRDMGNAPGLVYPGMAVHPVTGEIALSRMDDGHANWLGIQILNSDLTEKDFFINDGMVGGDCWTGRLIDTFPGPIAYGQDGFLYMLNKDSSLAGGDLPYIWKINTDTGAGARTSSAPWFGPLDESEWGVGNVDDFTMAVAWTISSPPAVVSIQDALDDVTTLKAGVSAAAKMIPQITQPGA